MQIWACWYAVNKFKISRSEEYHFGDSLHDVAQGEKLPVLVAETFGSHLDRFCWLIFPMDRST